MIDRLMQAWEGFLDLYVTTGAAGSAAVWAEDEVQILVACLLASSPGGALKIHADVAAVEGFHPVDFIVTDHGMGVAASPRDSLTPASPALLALDVRVVKGPGGRARAAESACKLQAVLRAGLAREAALCVVDRVLPADRRFYESLREPGGAALLLALDADLAARRGGTA